MKKICALNLAPYSTISHLVGIGPVRRVFKKKCIEIEKYD